MARAAPSSAKSIFSTPGDTLAAHAPGAVHDDGQRDGELAVFHAQFHRHGQQRVHRALEVPAGAEALFAAGHQQPSALHLHVYVERVEKLGRQLVRGHVVEDHGAGARQAAGVERGEVRRHLHVEALFAQDTRHGVVGIIRDQQQPGAGDDLDPVFGLVVAGPARPRPGSAAPGSGARRRPSCRSLNRARPLPLRTVTLPVLRRWPSRMTTKGTVSSGRARDIGLDDERLTRLRARGQAQVG